MGYFSQEIMTYLHNAQRRAVMYVDRLLKDFIKRVPRNTHVIITADHGELFGESDFFGHGPICHPLVNRVPYLEFNRSEIMI